mgnify:CR=1 FL=1
MKKLLLLMFLVPVIQAESPESESTDSKACYVNAGVRDTMKQVEKCHKGDVLVIKSSGYGDNVTLASKICKIDSIKFAGVDVKSGARTLCIYTGYTRTVRPR